MTQPMEFIWKTLQKEGDGSHIQYKPQDVDFLWHSGFVDTEQWSLEQWHDALIPFRQKDGNYRLTFDEFLTLEPYRYSGPIHVPFDALTIKEGKYTDEGLQKLIDASIAPSVSLNANDLGTAMTAIKEKFRQADHLILIQMPAKVEIAQLIEAHPSPRRMRELTFDAVLQEAGAIEETKEKIDALAPVATSEQRAAIEKSIFSELPVSKLEAESKRYQAVTKAKEHQQAESSASDFSLKDIKRSKKGFRG